MKKTIHNVRVGKADVKPDAAAHVRGVFQGNGPGHLRRARGIEPSGEGARGSARRSTGIRAKHKNAIDPRMPKISPA